MFPTLKKSWIGLNGSPVDFDFFNDQEISTRWLEEGRAARCYYGTTTALNRNVVLASTRNTADRGRGKAMPITQSRLFALGGDG
jgi:hypothetical protein